MPDKRKNLEIQDIAKFTNIGFQLKNKDILIINLIETKKEQRRMLNIQDETRTGTEVYTQQNYYKFLKVNISAYSNAA